MLVSSLRHLQSCWQQCSAGWVFHGMSCGHSAWYMPMMQLSSVRPSVLLLACPPLLTCTQSTAYQQPPLPLHQIFANDLNRGICPSKKVVCLVVDEAHRAVGSTDVVKAVGALRKEGVKFRVLALSATPGTDHKQVQVRVR